MVREDVGGKTAPRGVGFIPGLHYRQAADEEDRQHSRQPCNDWRVLARCLTWIAGRLAAKSKSHHQGNQEHQGALATRECHGGRGNSALPIRALVVFLARFRLNECFLQSTACRERFCHAGALALQQNADLKGCLGKMRPHEVTRYVSFGLVLVTDLSASPARHLQPFTARSTWNVKADTRSGATQTGTLFLQAVLARRRCSMAARFVCSLPFLPAIFA